MRKPLTPAEQAEVIINVLLEKEHGYALFGIEKEIITPLIKKGWIHADTYKHTGGATLTRLGREQGISTLKSYM